MCVRLALVRVKTDLMKREIVNHAFAGQVYCPICTHTVNGEVKTDGKKAAVVAGQKCPRCAASLDAGIVLHIEEAA
jgi:hypothetical protein